MLITLSRLRLWALLALVLTARSARADPEQILTLHYVADAGCPDAVRFRDEVLARVTRPIQFADQGGSRLVSVRIISDAAGVTAELLIEGPQQTRSLREFRTAACEDAVRAVALVAALAIDPNASLAADPRASLRPTPPPRPPRAEVVPLPGSATTTEARSLRVDLGPLIAGTFGPSPEFLSSGGIQVALDASGRSLAFLRRVALSLLASRSGILGPEVGHGSFTWVVSRLSVCPLALRVGVRGKLHPCWTTDGGFLRAQGSETAVENPQTAFRPWLATGVSLHLQQQTGRLIWGGGLGALAALTRDSFVFYTPEPEPVHDVPRVVLTAQLGLGFILGAMPP